MYKINGTLWKFGEATFHLGRQEFSGLSPIFIYL
jgi:hypothetical protein